LVLRPDFFKYLRPQGQDQDRFDQDQDLKKMVLRPVLRPRPVLRTTSLATTMN